MTYEAEQQIVKALRSLPWYMFLVPALFTLLILLFEPSVLTDTRPEYGYWAMIWIVAKLGFFVWVLRQLLRYGLFHWMTKLRKAISYSQSSNVAPVINHGVRVRQPSSNVTIIARREIPHHERRRMWR
jgi:hypothetical protein